MCIVWIGSLSYVVAWMITIIGDTLKIPDSVMGITFLAAGTSVPEAVSSVIVAKQGNTPSNDIYRNQSNSIAGHGSMGISNSIGSNTFDILLCLGLPWFIKATFMPIIPGKYWVRSLFKLYIFEIFYYYNYLCRSASIRQALNTAPSLCYRLYFCYT